METSSVALVTSPAIEITAKVALAILTLHCGLFGPLQVAKSCRKIGGLSNKINIDQRGGTENPPTDFPSLSFASTYMLSVYGAYQDRIFRGAFSTGMECVSEN